METPTLKSICFTGHRPTGAMYNINHPARIEIRRRLTIELLQAITKQNVSTFISGMALGFDVDAALSVLMLRDDHEIPGIYLTCALPYKGWDVQWSWQDKETYNKILAAANNVVYVCEPGFARWKYMERNKFMVNASESVLALWGGTPGGTANTVAYAISKGVPVHNLLTADVTTAPDVVKRGSQQRNWQRNHKKVTSG